MKIVRLIGEWTLWTGIAVGLVVALEVGIRLTIGPPPGHPEHLIFDPPGQPLASNSDARLRADIRAFDEANPYKVR